MTAYQLFDSQPTEHAPPDARQTSGRFAATAAMQTRYENAYSEPLHAAYLRTNPRAAARRQHAADGAGCRRLAHEFGLSLGYGVRVGSDGRLTRCYGMTLPVYWER